MANTIQARGQFWWFGESGQTSSLENSVHGLLTVTEEGDISLQLEGPLWLEDPRVSWTWDASRWLDSRKRIIGSLGEDGNEGCVLLCGLLRTDFSLGDKPARQSYDAEFCLKHDLAFPPDFDLTSFHSFRVELTDLSDWLQMNTIEVGREEVDGNHIEFTVRYDRIERVYVTSRAKVSIESLVVGNSPVFFSSAAVSSAHFQQTNWLVYEPKEQLSLTDLEIAFRRIEEVIALLLGRYFSLDWPKLVAKFREYDEWFTLYWKRGARSGPAPSIYFMATDFPSIGEFFGNMLERWETGVVKYGAGYDLFIASIRQPLPYPEHQFVNLVWALESLHRGWLREAGESIEVEDRKKRIREILARFSPSEKGLQKWLEGKIKYAYEPLLEERIYEVFQRLPFAMDTRKLRSFARRCASRRNDISHEGGPRRGENAEAFRNELREFANALHYLFHCVLLVEIGLSERLLLHALTERAFGVVNAVPAMQAVGIDLLSHAAPEKPGSA